MVKKGYIPDRGDIVWLDFNPQSGHEQRGKRPAIVLSHKLYNEKVGLAVLCPITSKEKGYPFEVRVDGKKVQGSILSDQIKSLDWQSRNIEFVEKATIKVVEEVIERFSVIIK